MKKWAWPGAFALLLCVSSAEDFKLTNGTIVRGDLSRVEPDGLIVVTDAGIQKLSFLQLPEETRKRYGFDLKKADEFRAQQAARQRQMLEQQAAAIRDRAARVQVLEESQSSLEDQQRRVKIEAEAINAEATIIQGTSKGARVQITIQTGRAARTMLDKDTRVTVQVGEGFVHGLIAADGDSWKGKLYPAGYHVHTTPFDGERTVRAYALSADAALAKTTTKPE